MCLKVKADRNISAAGQLSNNGPLSIEGFEELLPIKGPGCDLVTDQSAAAVLVESKVSWLVDTHHYFT